MLNLIQLNRPISVNGTVFENSTLAYEAFKAFNGVLEIDINVDATQAVNQPAAGEEQAINPSQLKQNTTYRLKVRKYMTEKASAQFDFMRRHNEDKPMPMRVMFGQVLEESKGMYKMEMHCRPEPTSQCMKCGRELTHPVSLLYGIGPDCGGHFHINPFNTEAELQAVYEDMKLMLRGVTWTGWVIKSAIESVKEVEA